MTDMPETIWAYYDEAQENAGGHIWYPGDEPEWDIGESAIYRRADLPPTLAQALKVPEVAAMVKALFHAQENEGDTWGIMHNQVMDLLCAIEAAMKEGGE